MALSRLPASFSQLVAPQESQPREIASRVKPSFQDGWHVVAGGRDVHLDQGQVELSPSCCRQEWQDRRFPAPTRLGDRRYASILSKALASTLPRVPRKVTRDRYVPSRRALWLLRREHRCWRNVNVQTNKTSTISSSRTTARSSGAVHRW